MILTFIHDGPLSVNKEGRFFDNCFTNEVFSRYFKIADRINVGIRIKSDTNIKGLSEITLDNINICPIANLSSLKGILFDSKKAKKEIEQLVFNADVLIIRLPSIIGLLSIKYARKYKKTYLVEMVGCPWDSLWNHSLKGKLLAPFMYFATRKAVKDAPYVLYVTNEFLQRRYPNNGVNIGCSDVALNEFNDGVLLKRINKISQFKDEIILGTTAAIDIHYKGQDLVLKAIAKLNKHGFNFKYRLVGGGNKTYLRSMAQKYGVADKIFFEGMIPHNKIFDFLDDIDVYIQPSKQEGMPRSLIEAMSRGCPCIGSNAGGIPELLDKEYIFSSGRVESIVHILAGFDRNKMLEQAQRNFEFSKMFMKEVLDARRSEFLFCFKEYASLQGEKY